MTHALPRRLPHALAMTLLLAACGPATPAENDDEGIATEQEELSTRTTSYVTLRRDQRRCMAPLCGGYFARDAVRPGAEYYVIGLDFAQSGLDQANQDLVLGAADGEVLLKARLGKSSGRPARRALLVYEAFLGMPGVTWTARDKLYSAGLRSPQIQCLVAPCHNLVAQRFGTTTKTPFTRVSVDAAAHPLVNTEWMTSRLLKHGGLVAAHLESGERLQGGLEKVLAASQLFVKLPESIGPCPAFRLAACPRGQVWSYTRNENRCTLPTGCVTPRMCRLMVPDCGDGYTLQSYSAGGCTQYQCDPAWSVPAGE